MAGAGKKIDVIGIGCAAVDDVLYVSSFPKADGKAAVKRRVRRFGGLTGAALAAAARLGARCAYAGQLGTDELSCAVRENFAEKGIDVSQAPISAEGRFVHSNIVVAEEDGSRTIFYESAGAIGPHPELPGADFLRSGAVLLMDHYGIPGGLRAARIAREAGVGIVADFEDERGEGFTELLDLVDHLILNAAFASQLTGKADSAHAAAALWSAQRAAVVVTCGAEGCWSVGSCDTHPVHHPALAVKAVDTTGCGDVFHGAYAVALARGEGLAQRIRFASAAAAFRASRCEFPTSADVDCLLSPSAARI